MSDAKGWCWEVAAAAIPRMRAIGSSRPLPLAIFHASAAVASVVARCSEVSEVVRPSAAPERTGVRIS